MLSHIWRGLALAFMANLLVMVALVGGPADFMDVLQASTQGGLPPYSTAALRGKVVLVTGANRGFGRAAAAHFLAHGARVVLACRSGIPAVGEELAAEVAAAAAAEAEPGGGGGGGAEAAAAAADRVLMLRADFSDLSSVAALADALGPALAARGWARRVDVAVLNAAVVEVKPRRAYADAASFAGAARVAEAFGTAATGGGVSAMFVVNYLSNVVLAQRLLAAKLLGRGSTVIPVGSGSYRLGMAGGSDGGTLLGAGDSWGVLAAMRYYGHTKWLLQVWATRQAAAGGRGGTLGAAGVRVLTLNPGPVDTQLGAADVPAPLVPSYRLMKAGLFLSPAAAAEPLLWMVSPEAEAARVPLRSGAFVNMRREEALEPSVLEAAAVVAPAAPAAGGASLLPPSWVADDTAAALAALGTGGPALALQSGRRMPLVGLGTWQSKPGEVGAAVRAALRAGYRHLDCAAAYGNEAEVGAVLAEMVGDGPGQIPRSELFVTSKLWNSEHAPENVRPALARTLADLRLAYVDLYLVHWPQAFAKVPGTHAGRPTNADGSVRYDTATTLADTWRAMSEVRALGLARDVGVSNFNSRQLAALLALREDDKDGAAAIAHPAVNQVESHPYFAQGDMLAFCAAHGVAVTAYSPLASGHAPAGAQPVVRSEVLGAIGARHGGRSAAQVAVAWQRQRGVVVIPKSVSAARVRANFDVFFELSADEMVAIQALDRAARFGWGGPKQAGQPPRDAKHPDYPFFE
jgi:alcohol dehydrogenase (NADP+)